MHASMYDSTPKAGKGGLAKTLERLSPAAMKEIKAHAGYVNGRFLVNDKNAKGTVDALKGFSR